MRSSAQAFEAPRALLACMAVLMSAAAMVATGAGGDPSAEEAARRIAERQRSLPWFWTPVMEGMADLPYTYTYRTRRIHNGGAETTMEMDRVPLTGGSYYRCLKQDGSAPCSPQIVEALERDHRKRLGFSADELARVNRMGEERRRARGRFWGEFESAFRFRGAGTNRIAFAPSPAYRTAGVPGLELLANIEGALTFDPQTHELTAMEYRVLRDAVTSFRGDAMTLAKGTVFSIRLEKLAGNGYVPARISVRADKHERTAEYSNFRRFAVESQFVPE